MGPVAISLISPEAGVGRNVVAYGLAHELASIGKLAIFRPVACHKETLTETLVSVATKQTTREDYVATCPCQARENPIQARANSLSTYTNLCTMEQPQFVLSVGSDNTDVVDPMRLPLDADIATDLRARVFLEICSTERSAKTVYESVKNCRRIVENAGTELAGIFITGCLNEQKADLKEVFRQCDTPLWLIDKVPFNLDPTAVDSRTEALDTFQACAPLNSLIHAVQQPPLQVTTPISFQNDLLVKAKSSQQTIVLPESEDDRILKAADYLLERDIVKLIIIGDRDSITSHGQELGLQHLHKASYQPMDDAQVLAPMVEQLCTLRANKGMTPEQARHQLTDPSYFGTMLVVEGLADGLVSGSVHSTASTVRPALQVIKTKPGTSLVSGAFLMCFKEHVALFADCAINLNPHAEQLADIAIQSAETARAFGIDPRVGMLSYSTLGSGKGPDVDLVEKATALVQAKRPDLPVVGPIQFDAAWSPEVAMTKAHDNNVAGHVNVFVFPSLSAGNIAYKAVQRSSGALAIGPVLQGLNKPVNDLSRGALVADIINTVALTAIEAQNH
ncbi:phosphate acetyltransferase [Bombiscardovia coagulans]|uniref:Phosphate acetyltransferase n=1 Tax=Bombiscardovia coagulans TaxID=686666 RepID=A0A261ETJ9_9BIFI|nr:phosphate acetyltransferase [Bombiscardovia coagulans]OZG49986.1 phosphate acetyltransferase [Bombiscardovia coagulans]